MAVAFCVLRAALVLVERRALRYAEPARAGVRVVQVAVRRPEPRMLGFSTAGSAEYGSTLPITAGQDHPSTRVRW